MNVRDIDANTAVPDAAPRVTSPSTLAQAWRTFFRFRSPLIMASLAAGGIATKLWFGDWSRWDLLVVLGLLLVWPVQEWLIHVLILHFEPKKLGRFTIDPYTSQKHRRHHRDPWRIELVFIPARVLPFTTPLLVLLWFGLSPTYGIAATGLMAYFCLAFHYEWVHYLVHTRYKPKSWYYERLWRSHRLHHFMNEHYWYGVSMLAGDRLLGTSPDPKSVEPSPTCRTLGKMGEV